MDIHQLRVQKLPSAHCETSELWKRDGVVHCSV